MAQDPKTDNQDETVTTVDSKEHNEKKENGNGQVKQSESEDCQFENVLNTIDAIKDNEDLKIKLREYKEGLIEECLKAGFEGVLEILTDEACVGASKGIGRLIARALVKAYAAAQARAPAANAVYIRRCDAVVYERMNFIPNEGIKQFSERIIARHTVVGFTMRLLLDNGLGRLSLVDVNDLVQCGAYYVVAPVYIRVFFKNVGHMDVSYFARSVKKYCKSIGYGGLISRQGKDPFYDILFYGPNRDIIDNFGKRLVGAEWMESGNNKNKKNDKDNQKMGKNNKNNRNKPNNGNKQNIKIEEKEGDKSNMALGCKGDNYECVVFDAQILAINGQDNMTIHTLKHATIAQNDVLPQDKNGRETGDDRAASSKASCELAEKQIAQGHFRMYN